jgi:protoporphyrinogen oxidase
MNMNEPVVIIGAGPAGLTAAYELSKHNIASVILEKDDVVGGLSRTGEYKGYHFDIGGHRFFTKVPQVQRIWEEMLKDDLLTVPRLSRIHYKSKFFNYPIEPVNALKGLGLFEAIRCVVSYAKAQIFPQTPEDDFQSWVSNRFGKRLFEIFFKRYTEKVWGIPCNQIRADWASQRIKGLTLSRVISDAFRLKRGASNKACIKSLIREFQYPRLGPGMLWSRMRDMVEARGSQVVLRCPVKKIFWESGRALAIQAGEHTYKGEYFLSSMPIRELIHSLEPKPPQDVLTAADDFHYRDFMTVILILRGRDLFPDNWIYVHDPEVKLGRIQNYNNWSSDMSPDPNTTCLGLEYFCSEGDDLWNRSNEELISQAAAEISQIGLAKADSVIDGLVVRVRKAYPVYDATYKRGINAVRSFLNEMPNLQLMGRNGMHHYNNQDHSMLTGMLAARNILGANYNLWEVNSDIEYHEQSRMLTAEQIEALESSQPLVPRTILAEK